ncbi:MAG TPA: hypothetical protein VE092_14860 [Herbaspirillum sp.]|uniref:hypothetical protein n=1 Tax=Herbaspirillum sp. TaxID=1890675 RepID=UPI002D2740E6|nr:hypothetical protein [Herbaspirillum sp.]HZG21289.1 hypothetical protein [Herbaspirillum sp.]
MHGDRIFYVKNHNKSDNSDLTCGSAFRAIWQNILISIGILQACAIYSVGEEQKETAQFSKEAGWKSSWGAWS